MYIILNKRQRTGEVLKSIEFVEKHNGYDHYSSIELIKLAKPYKNGTAYAVNEQTCNTFCSSGLYSTLEAATDKYNLMRRNCNLITDQEFDDSLLTDMYKRT